MERSIYYGTFGVLLLLTITLTVVFRTLFESAPIGFGLIEPAGRIVESNSALNRLLGVQDSQRADDVNFFDCFGRREDVDRFGDQIARQPSLAKFECDLVRSGASWNTRLTASTYTFAGKPLILVIVEDVSR